MAKTLTLWTLLLAALVVAPLACAQQGPVPGSDPVSYARDHYEAEAANATSDPAAYAQSQASPETVGEQAHTAAYVACWAAYEAAGMAADPVCASFFTPRERAPRPHSEDITTQEAQDALNATVEGAEAFANTTLDALNRTVTDPGDAPSQVRRILDAAAGFANGTVALAVKVVKGIVGGAVALVLGIVDAILHSLGLGAKGAAMAGGAVVDFLGAAVDEAVGAAVALVDGVVEDLASASASIASGVAGFLGAVVDGIGAAIGAVVDGVTAAGGATVDALAGAVEVVGGFVGSIVDAVSGIFGGQGSKAPSGPSVPDLGRQLPADDLLGSVRNAVPL